MTGDNTTCVLASGNKGKLAELSQALSAHHITLRPQSDFNITEADETAVTFVENALIKARHASSMSGLAALADDSGLVVDALQGAPGIYSARYAADKTTDTKPSDAENIDKLLAELKGESNRSAHFVCVLVLLQHEHDPLPLIATGIWHGNIIAEADGSGGFGYDPVFYCPETRMTAAQMQKSQKQAISHRARALETLHIQLKALRAAS